MWLSRQGGAPPALRGDSIFLPAAAAAAGGSSEFPTEIGWLRLESGPGGRGLPLPEVLQAEQDLSTTLGTEGRPGHLGCWVGHRALARSAGVWWLG